MPIMIGTNHTQTKHTMNKSESITKLAAALGKFHGAMGKVGKDSVNPHFRNKYASLSNIIEAVTPHLNAAGLTIIQMPTTEGLNTMLLHESGEYISSVSAIAAKDPMNPQAVGSAITYARRYALGSVLLLNIDEDDDATAATVPPKAAPAPQPKALPALTPEDSDKWAKAIAALSTGSTTIEKIRKAYTLSDHHEALLTIQQ
jgi:hypothetical protein